MALPEDISIQTKFDLSTVTNKYALTLLTDFDDLSIALNLVKGNYKITNPIGIDVWDNQSLVSPDVYSFSVTGIVRSGTVATVTTSAAHGLSTGWSVRISDADQSDYNGIKEVTVLTATTFSFTVNGSAVTPATGTILGLKISLNTVPIQNDEGTLEPISGTYTIVSTVVVASGPSAGTYEKSFSYEFDYVKPEAAISQSINVFLPRIYSTDNTIYTVGGIVPTLARVKTIYYPTDSGFSPTSSSNQTDEVNPPKVWNGTYTTTVSSYVTYVMDDGLVIYDRITGSQSNTFVADVDLCSINCCLNNLNNTYKGFIGKNTKMADEYQEKLNRGLQLKNLYLGNIQCGNSEQAAKNLEDFYCVTGCSSDCDCGEPTGPIAPYGGYVGSTILEYNAEIPFFVGQYVNYENALYKIIVDTSAAQTPVSDPDSFELLFSETYESKTSVQTITSQATITPTHLNYGVVVNALAEATTINNPTGTWSDEQALLIRILDNGVSRAITYGSQYRAVGTTLPTATTIGKTLYIGVVYNAYQDTFDIIGVNQEA